MKISEKIALCRKEHGMSQEELAAMLDISRQAVSRWETGAAMPDTEKIIQLSRVFGVTTDYLLLDEVEEKRPEAESKPAQKEEAAQEKKAESAAEVSVATSVKERRRKFRMAAWISFLVVGLCVVLLAVILASAWALTTDWWYTKWGRFGTGLFHTEYLAVFIIGFILMIPGFVGLVWEYKRED